MDDLALARSQLYHRMSLLLQQLRVWLSHSRTGASRYARHRSQIRAFSQILLPTLRDIRKAACDGQTTVADVRMLSLDLLALFRVWEFLRSKLAQRSDEKLAKALEMADDFAWYCFEKVARGNFCQPPLVFLNGGYSPYTVPRHMAFQAERVVGDAREGQVIRTLTSDLPFPIIGLPWYQTSAIWDLPLVAHEVGHAVEADLKLKLQETIAGAVSDPARKKDWQRWASEIFGDFYAATAVDSAFTSALASFLAAAANGGVPPEYPPPSLRFHFNLHFLPDNDPQKSRLAQRWAKDFAIDATNEKYFEDFSPIAAAFRSLDIGLTPVAEADRRNAAQLADMICSRTSLQGRAYDTRVVVMAARGVFDRLVMSGPFQQTVERCQELVPVLNESVKQRLRAGGPEAAANAQAQAAAQARVVQTWSERFCTVRRTSR